MTYNSPHMESTFQDCLGFLTKSDTIFHSYLSNVFDVLQFNDNIFCTRRFDLLKAQVTVDSNNNNDVGDKKFST